MTEKKRLTKAEAGRLGGLKGGRVSRGGGRPKRWSDEMIAEARQLRADGMTLKQIGDQFGVSESRVSKILAG